MVKEPNLDDPEEIYLLKHVSCWKEDGDKVTPT